MAKLNAFLIKKNYTKLLEINPQEIIDHLYQEEIIKYNEKQMIETQVVDKEKSRKLLDCIIQKGENAATCFLEILKNCDPYRYQDILQTNSGSFYLDENSIATFDSIQEASGNIASSTSPTNHQNIALPVVVSIHNNEGNNAEDMNIGFPLNQSDNEDRIQELSELSAPTAITNSCQDLDLLIVGKTGNGKSATANSILLLKNKLFKTGDSFMSVTQKVQVECRKIRNRFVTVVDGPGIGDTSDINNVQTATIKVIESMKEVVALSQKGYNAIILVVRYGGRFTKEDTECIRILKHIFGHDFIKDFCILLVTCGDDYAKNQEISFIEWCNEQEGYFSLLLNECDKRVVLFDNKTTNDSAREIQLDKLIEMIVKLQQGRHRYKMSNYILSEENRALLLAQVKEPKIREDTVQELKEILDKYQMEFENKNIFCTTTDKLKTLHNKILYEYKGTGMCNDILMMIDTTLQSIEIINSLRNNYEIEKEQKIAAENEKFEMLIKNSKAITEKLMTERKEKEEMHIRFKLKEQEELQKMEERNRKETANILNEQQAKFKKERDSLLKDKHDVEEQYNTLLENQTLGEPERQKLTAELEKKKNEYSEQLSEIENRQMQQIDQVKIEASDNIERERESSRLRLQEEEERQVKEMNEANASLQRANKTIESLTEEYYLNLLLHKTLHETALQNLKLNSEKEIAELKKKLEKYSKFPYNFCVII